MDAEWTALAAEWNWTWKALAVLAGAWFADVVLRRLIARAQVRLERRNHSVWAHSAIAAARAPLGVAIWIAGVALAARIVEREADSLWFEWIGPARDIGMIAAVTWFLLRWIREGETWYAARPAEHAPDGATIVFVGRLLRIAAVTAGILALLQALGFSVTGLLAFGGVGGIVVGFAAKDLLANFFGGLMIFLDRPFAVGDWIRSPDREIEGIVEDISWRVTLIRTFDKRPLYVPNAVFSTITVENGGRMTHRRIREWIGIRYEDAAKVEPIVAALREMFANHPQIDTEQTPVVALDRLAPSSLDILIQAYSRETDYPRFQQVKQDVLLKVLDIVGAHDAEIAYPTSVVHAPAGLILREEGANHVKWPVEMSSEGEHEGEFQPSWRREKEEK